MSISIPPFTNVPAPGDPITSAWAQQLTQYAVDIRANIGGRVVEQSMGATYSTAFAGSRVKVCDVTVAAQARRRAVILYGRLLIGYGLVAGEQIDMHQYVNGVESFQFWRGVPGQHFQIVSWAGILNANTAMTAEFRAVSVTGATRSLVDGIFYALAYDYA